MEMASALLRAGVVSQDDVKRLEVEQEIEAELERAARLVELEFDDALRRNRYGYEIKAWMRDTGRLVPLEVLNRWAELDEREQSIEWSKWLAAYREVTAAEN